MKALSPHTCSTSGLGRKS